MGHVLGESISISTLLLSAVLLLLFCVFPVRYTMGQK